MAQDTTEPGIVQAQNKMMVPARFFVASELLVYTASLMSTAFYRQANLPTLPIEYSTYYQDINSTVHSKKGLCLVAFTGLGD